MATQEKLQLSVRGPLKVPGGVQGQALDISPAKQDSMQYLTYFAV